MAESVDSRLLVPKGHVAVERSDGSVGSVPKSELQKELAAESRVVDAATYRKAALGEKYSGAGDKAAALGLGAASGLTFGASDVAARAVGAGDYIKESQEALPGWHTAGEVGGIVVGGLASGGSGLAAKAISAPTRLAMGAGRLAEGATARVIGRGAESLGGKLLQKAIPAAVGAGVETGFYGAGHELSDQAIQGKGYDPEKILAAYGKTAVTGALIGGGLSGATTLIGEGVKRGVGAITKNKSIAEVLEGAKESSIMRSSGLSRTAKETEGVFATTMRERAQLLEKEAPSLVGKQRYGQLVTEDMPAVAEAGIAKHAAARAEVIAGAEAKLAGKAAATSAQLAQDIHNAAAKHVIGQTGKATETKVIDEIANMLPKRDLFSNGDASLQALHDVRQQVASRAAELTQPGKESVRQVLTDIGEALDKRIVSALETGGGKSAVKAYANANKALETYQMVQSGIGQAAKASPMSNFIASAAGGQIGSMLGGAVTPILGHGIGGLAGMGAANLAGKLVRQRGDFVAVDMINRMKSLGALEGTAARVDGLIEKGARNFVVKPLAADTGAGYKAAERRRNAVVMAQRLADVTGSPEHMASKVEAIVGSLPSAPRTSAALSSQVVNQISYLASKAPQVRTNASNLTLVKPLRVSDSEISRFARIIEGTTDPLSILADMQRGKLSREKIAAVRETSPKLYESIREKVLDHVAESGKELPYQKRLQINVLFGGGVADDTFESGFIRSQQEAKSQASEAPQEQSGPAKTSKRPIKLDSDAYELDTP